jgi:diaminopimelate decarboxylase
MHYFQYKNDQLHCEDVSIRQVCDEVGTPVYVYSRATLERHFKVFREPFKGIDHLICYSMKACSNLAVLRIFGDLDAGVDIVSGGELFRALMAGLDPQRIVYSGVGKTAGEMDEALLADILMFNVESEEELDLLNERAGGLGKKARIALRVNPDVDPRTHPYISTGLRKNKFGIDSERSIALYRRAKELDAIEPIGIDCHIGSQLTELSPFLEALARLKEMVDRLRDQGIDVRYLDIGGGLGIPYNEETPPAPADYGAAVVERIADMDLTLILEPGRVLTGNAGILVTKVLYGKAAPEKYFVIVDAAMNDLMRPSLYEAHHSILPVSLSDGDADPRDDIVADVVGPICESGDFFARDREMTPVEPGDLLAVMSAGAYGFSMSSNYNSRARVAEVLVDGAEYFVVRDRETYQDLVRGERIPPRFLQRD